jgi:hypothetical protein
MTEVGSDTLVYLRDGDEGPFYAVPAAVMAAHRATPAQLAAAAATTADAEGFGLPPEVPIHLLTAEDLAPFRVSDEEADAEVRGYEQFIGIFGSSRPGAGPGYIYVRLDGFVSAWLPYGWIPASQSGSSNNADGTYHPPLH